MADSGDAACYREILFAVRGPRLNGFFDRTQARLDGFGLLDEFLSPLAIVEVEQFVMSGAQALPFGLLLLGGRARLWRYPPKARDRAPVGLQGHLGPLPAR